MVGRRLYPDYPAALGYIHPMFLFGCDFADEGFELGSETKLRCEKAAEVFRELRDRGRINPIIFLAAGCPEEGYSQQYMTMTEMMVEYLVKHDVSIRHIERCDPAWGTRDELRSMLSGLEKMIGEYNIDVEEMSLTVVTSWYHEGRIGLLLRKFATRPLSIEYVHPDKWFLRMALREAVAYFMVWSGLSDGRSYTHDTSVPSRYRNEQDESSQQ